MLIALDYDDTFTRDPDMWLEFILLAKSLKHQVMCVTMRYEVEGEPVQRALQGKVDQIVFTGRNAKKNHMDALGFQVNVWIDDSPHFIIFNALHDFILEGK